MHGPIVQQAEGLSFHESENLLLESVVDRMRANITLTEEKLMQLASSNREEFPVSLVQFQYFTYGAYGTQWNLFVSFRDNRFARVRARGNEITIHAKSGYLTISNSLRPFTNAFVHTIENWERALQTAFSVIDADDVNEIVGISRIVDCLWKHKWGQSSLIISGRQKNY